MSEKDSKNIMELEGHGLHIPAPPGSDIDKNTNLPPADDIYTGQEYQTSPGKEEKKEKQPSVGRDISILVIITVAAGVLLGAAYGVTKDPIAQAQAKAKAKAQSAVMPGADGFQVMYTDDGSEGEQLPDTISDAIADAGIETTSVSQIDVALDENGEVLGYVVTSSNPDGYGGDVEMMSGVTKNEDGTVTIEGISFLSLSETAGMGMRAKDDEFSGQFAGLQIPQEVLLVYVKDGADEPNEIDAISGCTITTSAVTDNVNAALIAVGQTDGALVTSEAAADQEDGASEAAADQEDSSSEAAAGQEDGASEAAAGQEDGASEAAADQADDMQEVSE